MGVELQITRAEFWADNDVNQISAQEWMAYVASDPELRPDPVNSPKNPYMVIWLGQENDWFDWHKGNIYSKWPSTELYRKMLRIARALNAQVQRDDDNKVFTKDTDWEFNPDRARSDLIKPKVPFWQFLFRRKRTPD
jgi:hypothetical protein